MSARFTVADLAGSGILDIGRNRERVAEAAGMRGVQPLKRAVDIGPETEACEHGSVLPREPASTQAREPGSTPPWRDPLLLAVLGEPRKLPALTGEDALQAEIVWRAREAARAGRWQIIVTMCRNDVRERVMSAKEAERQPALIRARERQLRHAGREGARALAMGLQPGWPDLHCEWPGGCGYLECKSPGKYPSPEQRAVRDLMQAWGRPWALVRSWDETLAVWRRWGVPGVGA